jgi:RNase P subunit RPR2
MKTRRQLAQEQLDLMSEIQEKTNINMVTCGHCGTILLHKIKTLDFKETDEEGECLNNIITCFGCKHEISLTDCPDFWYSGMIENSEFDE